jgi:hypothetical protein
MNSVNSCIFDKNLAIFLINAEIATRKWILGDLDEENEEENELKISR